MKRHRDIFFKSQSDISPPSIILTTLCGEYYTNQGSILDDMISIVGTIKGNPTIRVCNPVNPSRGVK